MHSLIADLLGYGDEFAINIHMGGVYGDKHQTAGRFLREFSRLPDNIKRRLTLENDDKPSMWSMTELFKEVGKHCTVKLVLDIHHHRFCQQESLSEAADMAFRTWSGFCEIPKVHYSESKEGARPQAHSDYIRKEIPPLSDTVEYDVMIEAKAKDLALLEYRKVYSPCLV
jgi:UV DNA damage endonuclease